MTGIRAGHGAVKPSMEQLVLLLTLSGAFISPDGLTRVDRCVLDPGWLCLCDYFRDPLGRFGDLRTVGIIAEAALFIREHWHGGDRRAAPPWAPAPTGTAVTAVVAGARGAAHHPLPYDDCR